MKLIILIIAIISKTVQHKKINYLQVMNKKLQLIDGLKKNQSYLSTNNQSYIMKNENIQYPYILKGQLTLKMKLVEISENQQQFDDAFQDVFFIVNDHVLYFMSDDFDFQNVISSIQLSSLFNFKFNSIQNIASVYKIQAQFCFNVKTEEIIFKLCKGSQKEDEELRESLINTIIRLFSQEEQVKKGVKCGRNDLIDYELDDQFEWPCNCKNSDQSPLLLSQLQAEWMDDDRLFFKFIDITCIRYARINKIAQYYGDMGIFVHRLVRRIDADNNRTERMEYKIYKMMIRIRGEHELIGYYPKHNDMSSFTSEQDYRARAKDSYETFQLELQFYAFDQNNDECVFSVMIQTASDINFNPFLENLNFDSQEFRNNHYDNPFIDNSNQLANLRSLIFKNDISSNPIFPNLWQLFPEYFNLSFFYYQGSDTIPPCVANLKHIILKHPILIPMKQFQKIREKLIDGENYNNRGLQKLEDRKYYYHNENECIKPKETPKQFIKLTQKYSTYAVGEKNVTKFQEMFDHHGSIPIKLHDGNIQLKPVQESQVDSLTKEILNDQYKFKIKGNHDYQRLEEARQNSHEANLQLKDYESNIPHSILQYLIQKDKLQYKQ